MRRLIRALKLFPLFGGLPLLIVGIVLSTVDLFGAGALVHDIYQLSTITNPHPTGFMLDEGFHDLWSFDLTMLEDGTRLVPNSQSDACKIAFVGDSFIFGFGVNDEDTIANQVARRLNAYVINTGRNGYNTQQALEIVNFYPAHLYVYLHTWNDNELRFENTGTNPNFEQPNLLFLNLSVITGTFFNSGKLETDNEAHAIALEELLSRDNVLIFAINLGFNIEVLERYPEIIPLPQYAPNYVSSIDTHPNAVGNEILVDAMLPHIQEAYTNCETQ